MKLIVTRNLKKKKRGSQWANCNSIDFSYQDIVPKIARQKSSSYLFDDRNHRTG